MERAHITIYDPKVEEAQIWLDLAEACPTLTLEQSMSSPDVIPGIRVDLACIAVKKQITIASSSLEACKQKEAIVIATEWREFREIDWQTVYADMTKPAFVFDGRLLVDADKLREIGFKARILSVFFHCKS